MTFNAWTRSFDAHLITVNATFTSDDMEAHDLQELYDLGVDPEFAANEVLYDA